MPEIDFQKIQKLAAAYISDWVESLPEPDKPVVRCGGDGGTVLSPRQVLKHFQEATPLGEELIAHWVAVTYAESLKKPTLRGFVGKVVNDGSGLLSSSLPTPVLEWMETLKHQQVKLVTTIEALKVAGIHKSELLTQVIHEHVDDVLNGIAHLVQGAKPSSKHSRDGAKERVPVGVPVHVPSDVLIVSRSVRQSAKAVA